MKNKLIWIIISVFLLISFSGLSLKAAEPPGTSATAAVVMDMETGQVLYNKHMHLHRPPASLTKILTTIIAIDRGNLKDKVKVSRRAAYQEGSSIYLEEGEVITLEELLYGVMLASGNDAAAAVAEHISGSIEDFAELMNKKAEEIGARNSNFLNPNGLPQSGHYSSAYDLALIMRYALNNEIFARITATKYKTISWGNNDWDRGLRNHHSMLFTDEDITGGKTGYTRAAGQCLVTSARKDGREVIVVVLNCPGKYIESRKLIDYGINGFKRVTVINKNEVFDKIEVEGSREKELKIVASSPLTALVPRGGELKIKKEAVIESEIMLPVEAGERIGTLNIYDQDILLGKTDLIAGNSLNFNSVFLRFWHWFTTLIS